MRTILCAATLALTTATAGAAEFLWQKPDFVVPKFLWKEPEVVVPPS